MIFLGKVTHLNLSPHLLLHVFRDHLILAETFENEYERVGFRLDPGKIDLSEMAWECSSES
jgi:hypothetical protein